MAAEPGKKPAQTGVKLLKTDVFGPLQTDIAESGRITALLISITNGFLSKRDFPAIFCENTKRIVECKPFAWFALRIGRIVFGRFDSIWD